MEETPWWAECRSDQEKPMGGNVRWRPWKETVRHHGVVGRLWRFSTGDLSVPLQKLFILELTGTNFGKPKEHLRSRRKTERERYCEHYREETCLWPAYHTHKYTHTHIVHILICADMHTCISTYHRQTYKHSHMHLTPPTYWKNRSTF